MHSCTFEVPCAWKPSVLRRATGQEVNNSWVSPRGRSEEQPTLPPGPFFDASNKSQGHFLWTRGKDTPHMKTMEVRSPRFPGTGDGCVLLLALHMSNMKTGIIKLIIEGTNHSKWIPTQKSGNDLHAWTNYTLSVGKITQEFNIIVEIIPPLKKPYHIAMDNLQLKDCFPGPPQNVCSSSQFQCSNGSCIDITKVCNINVDCPGGEDEHVGCFKVPHFARCTFEDGLCGWHNSLQNKNGLNWTIHNGSTATPNTGPNFDHTFQNSTGFYLYVDMAGKTHDLGTPSSLESPLIYAPPPYHSNSSSPYYNSCYITFHYHKYGHHSGSLALFLIEVQGMRKHPHNLWWKYGDQGEKWFMQVVTLPPLTTNSYFLQFEARRGFASRGDQALDDISMSPQCFGLEVPADQLGNYDYGKNESQAPTRPPPHVDFENSTSYHFTTCGKTGRYGPSPENCTDRYNNTNVDVEVLTTKLLAGIQKWTVPETGYYTLIAKGASGGRGSDRSEPPSPAAVVRGVVELVKGSALYILVGHKGLDACRKGLSSSESPTCQAVSELRSGSSSKSRKPKSKMEDISKIISLPEGGGGGGGTFVFFLEKNVYEPVMVASGGGGLGHTTSHTTPSPAVSELALGHGINSSLMATTGDAYRHARNGPTHAGAGGGWSKGNLTYKDQTGLALLQGGAGGKACYISSDGSEVGDGGFGGGGGGCTAGGGGGGYSGGRAWSEKASAGEGGFSYVGTSVRMAKVWPGTHYGDGEILIIPAVHRGCDCDYKCVVLDIYRHSTKCLCPDRWHLSNDSTSCLLSDPQAPTQSITVTVIIVILVLLLVILFVFAFLYSSYQRKRAANMRRLMLSGPDLQLNRLRGTSDSMVTEYNPNYEFGGGTYSLRDLKEIPREHLRLVKSAQRSPPDPIPTPIPTSRRRTTNPTLILDPSHSVPAAVP